MCLVAQLCLFVTPWVVARQVYIYIFHLIILAHYAGILLLSTWNLRAREVRQLAQVHDNAGNIVNPDNLDCRDHTLNWDKLHFLKLILETSISCLGFTSFSF